MGAEAADLLERVRRFAMPEGDVEPSDVRFSQQGEMRLTPGAPWRPFRAEQRMWGSSIDFRWRAWFRMAPFAPVRVNSFENGAGALHVKAFGVLPVANGRGPAFDRGEAMRGLAELPWRTFAFAGMRGVTFGAAGEGRLLARFDDGRTRAEVELVLGPRAGRPSKRNGLARSPTIGASAASASRPRRRPPGFFPRVGSPIGAAASLRSPDCDWSARR